MTALYQSSGMGREVGSERMKRISVGVQDEAGVPHAVSLAIDERAGQGSLSIQGAPDVAGRRFDLSELKKSPDGRTLQCRISGATATLALDAGADASELRVVARLIVPIFDARYRIAAADYKRLAQWIKTLAIDRA
jgi:hypothetical protein